MTHRQPAGSYRPGPLPRPDWLRRSQEFRRAANNILSGKTPEAMEKRFQKWVNRFDPQDSMMDSAIRRELLRIIGEKIGPDHHFSKDVQKVRGLEESWKRMLHSEKGTTDDEPHGD